MKATKIYILAALATLGLTSCGHFGDLNVNPNYPSESMTYSQFLFSSRYVKYFVCNSYYYDIWTQEYPGYLSESKNNQYGPLNCTTQFSTSDYYSYALRTLNEIIEQNEGEDRDTPYILAWGSHQNQIAICRTLRAFFYMSLTDIVGPTPYSQALMGAKLGIWEPKFDNTDYIITAKE